MILEHVGIKVSNLQRSIEFYGKAFGFKVLRKTPVAAYLYLENDLLELIQSREPQEEKQIKDSQYWEKTMFGSPGLSHVGFRVDDLDDEIKRLKELGCELISQPTEYKPKIEYIASPKVDKLERASGQRKPSWRMASVADPDGTVLELLER